MPTTVNSHIHTAAAYRATTLDGAFMQVPFVGVSTSHVSFGATLTMILGTSITLFIVTLPICPVNASVAVDDEAPTIRSFHQTEGPSNVPLYSSALLPFGNHTVTVNLLDSTNGFENSSCLFFDYATVNDTLDGVPSPATSAEGTPTSTPNYEHLS